MSYSYLDMSSNMGMNIGTIATPIVGVTIGVVAVATAGVIGSVGYEIASVVTTGYSVISSTKDLIKIHNDEKEFEKKLTNKIKELSLDNDNDITTYIDKIKKYVVKSGLINNENFDKNLNRKNKKDQLNVAYDLFDLVSKYNCLKENIYSLNDIASFLNIDINEILSEYELLHDINNTCEISKKMDELNDKINNLISQYKNEIEEGLKNKKFVANFINVNDVKEKLFINVFNNEITNLLNNPTTEDVKELVNEKNTLDLLIKIYNAGNTMSENPIFDKYSNKVLSLWGSSINLSERKDLSLDDYNYEVNLKLDSLKYIEKEMNKQLQKEYQSRKRFNEIIAINNNYRKLLNLDPSKKVFNNENYVEDIKYLQKENEELLQEYKKKYLAQYITTELKAKYAKANYKYIPTNSTVNTNKHTIIKSYFITPDGKNVLCLNVNDKGNISEEVVGMKVFGLRDDVKSIYEAQKNCCSHTKKILDDLFKKLDVDPKVERYEPDINKTVFSRDFTNILPDNAINEIKQNRLNRTHEEQRKREINNG